VQESLWHESSVGFIPSDRSTDDDQNQEVRLNFDAPVCDTIAKMCGGKAQAAYLLLSTMLHNLLWRYSFKNQVSLLLNAFPNEADDRILKLIAISPQWTNLPSLKDAVLEFRSQYLKAINSTDAPDSLDLTVERSETFITIATASPYCAPISLQSDKMVSFNFILHDLTAMSVELTGKSKYYSSDMLLRAGGHFLALLKLSVAKPSAPLNADFLPLGEREKVYHDFNATQRPYPRESSIVSLLEIQTLKSPHSIAVEDTHSRYSYIELWTTAHRIAAALVRKGVAPNSIVGLFGERSSLFILGMCGILKAGAAYVPLDATLADNWLKTIITEGALSFVLCPKKEADRVRALGVDPILIEDSFLVENSTLPVSGADSIAYIMYTSGSTGKPKGVMVTHRNIVRLVINSTFMELNEKTRFMMTGSPGFDAATLEIWGALLNGGYVYIPDTSVILDPDRMEETLIKRKINSLWVSSPLLNQLVQKRSDLFSSIKFLLSGGDILNPQTIGKIRAANNGLTIINGYGPTENTTFSTTMKIEKEYSDTIPIGKPIDNSTVFIVDRTGNLCGIGIFGEIWVGGDGVAKGYLNDDALTRSKFVATEFCTGNVYRTGDIGRWLDDGTIEFWGRMDSQTKIRGYRIEIEHIRRKILQMPAIDDVVIVVRLDENNDKYLCGFFTAKKAMSTTEIRKEFLKELPTYMFPSYLIQLDAIPLNQNGKVNNVALPDTTGKRPVLDVPYEAPLTEKEKQIAEIWSSVLKISQIGVNDNFFELGGNSLKAMSVIGALNNGLTLGDLYANQTIKELVAISQSPFTSLQLLHGSAQKEPLSLLCAPYGGGSGTAFKGIAQELAAIRTDCSIYNVNVPGIDTGAAYESITVTARTIVSEFCKEPSQKIVLYGHCAYGAALVVEIATLLENQGKSPLAVIVGAVYPPLFNPFWGAMKLWYIKKFIGLTYVTKLFKTLGKTITEAQEPGVKKMLETTQKAIVDVHQYYYHRNKKSQLKSPLVFVVGTSDPATRDYQKKVKLWNRFFNDVQLISIDQADHFFIESYAAKTASIISNVVETFASAENKR
jgi:amino acid adenylation domain-containing protein